MQEGRSVMMPVKWIFKKMGSTIYPSSSEWMVSVKTVTGDIAEEGQHSVDGVLLTETSLGGSGDWIMWLELPLELIIISILSCSCGRNWNWFTSQSSCREQMMAAQMQFTLDSISCSFSTHIQRIQPPVTAMVQCLSCSISGTMVPLIQRVCEWFFLLLHGESDLRPLFVQYSIWTAQGLPNAKFVRRSLVLRIWCIPTMFLDTSRQKSTSTALKASRFLSAAFPKLSLQL